MSELKFDPILPLDTKELIEGFGAKRASLKWCLALRAGIADNFKEKVYLVDWGCGAGRFGNFMSSCLKDFRYLGYEPDTGHGRRAISIALSKLNDQRLTFTNNKNEAFVGVNEADIVLLGSVFTHLTIESSAELLDAFFQHNPKIICVFTIILGDEYRLEGRDAFDLPGCFNSATYTDKEMDILSKIANIEQLSQFKTRSGMRCMHRIMRATLR